MRTGARTRRQSTLHAARHGGGTGGDARGSVLVTRSAAPSRFSQRAIMGRWVCLSSSLNYDWFANLTYSLVTDHRCIVWIIQQIINLNRSKILRLTLSRPVPNLTCDCLAELSVRVLCFTNNITCTVSRAQFFSQFVLCILLCAANLCW